MRRTDVVEIVVAKPTAGLVTDMPSDMPERVRNRALTIAKNVRAEFGVLRNAPGFERIVPDPANFSTPANLIFQANILNSDPETRTQPIIGTEESLYLLRRRAAALSCEIGGGGGSSCPQTVAFLGDSGKVGADLEAVADLIKGWGPDFIVHTGDMAYSGGGTSSTINDFEECVGQYFYDFIGGYNGVYGVGPAANKFFPVLGNHDWDDAGISNYYDFFQLQNNERYFHYKRGPLHFVHLSGHASDEPDGVAFNSVQGAWAQAIIEASDCPWVIVVVHFPPYTSDSSYHPGITALRWPFKDWGASAVVSGHAHNSEIVVVDDFPYFISGTGGHSLRGFNATPVAGSLWKQSAVFGALRLDATKSQLTWKFIDVDGNILQTYEMDEPRESSGICYVGTAAKQIFTLEVKPASAVVEVGYSWPFEAFAHYQDGTIENVTLQSIWTSEDPSIGAVAETSGVATGISPGTVDITATFRDESASGEFTVLHSCLDDPLEICFVVARNGSMNSTADGATRLQHIKEGVELCIDTFRDDTDKLALASFAGVYATQTEDAVLNQSLTDDFEAVKYALSTLSASEDTGIASGLDIAHTELTSSRHSSGTARAVVLIVDGAANVTDPGGTTASESAAIAAAMSAASTSAAVLRALEVRLVVIGYAIPAAYLSLVQGLATPGFYFGVDNPSELKATLGSLANVFCLWGDDYYYEVNTDLPVSPKLDYRDLVNWDVIQGCVDLCGMGSNGVPLYDIWPGNGLYLDLTGTNPVNATAFGSGYPQDGKIRSKLTFSFIGGKTYRLSFYLAGAGLVRTTLPDFQVGVSIDNNVLPQETIVIDDPDQDFTLYEYEFTPGADTSGRVIFEQLPGPSGRTSTIGNFLDVIELRNVTDATVMLLDTFDTENPV